MKHPLILSMEGPDLGAIAAGILEWPFFAGTPRRFSIRQERQAETPSDWKRVLASAGEGSAFLSPPGVPQSAECRIGIAAGLVVTSLAPQAFSTVEEVLRRVEPLPFTIAAFGEAWPEEWRGIEHETFGFANSHTRLGWACAFKGAGHDRLVSRRWLDFGPWRALSGHNDLTLVQFHDLGVGADEALGQALPGHARMGISEGGGFVQGPSAAGKGIKYSPLERFPEGLYDAGRRTLEVVVAPGREVGQGEMLDACAYRLNKRADKATPIESIAYVFMTDSAARDHLHELWLRELEVWTVEAGPKRRIDLGYKPEPTRPDWVRNLERKQ